MDDITIYGFDGSTYVRTVKMLLAGKEAAYNQVAVDVLKGEPKQPEHLARHPFGKVPVLDHNGLRIVETSAITRYLNEAVSGPSFVPDTLEDRARMDMAMGIVDSYGYDAMVGGVVGYHLFPDFVGGKNEDARQQGLEDTRLVLSQLMKLRDGDAYIAGEISLADLYLAPLCFYLELTPDARAVFAVDDFEDWWQRMKGLDIYISTEPALN